MSREDLDVLRRIMDCANQRDVDGLVQLVAEDVVAHPDPDHPGAGVIHGRDAFATYLRSWLDSFEEYDIRVLEYLDLGEYVAAVGHVRARGRVSGAVVESGDAWLYRFENGLMVEYRECRTKEALLEAAARE